MENLGRGVVAVRSTTTEVVMSWRVLGTDPPDIAFNLYRSTAGGAPSAQRGANHGATYYVDSTRRPHAIQRLLRAARSSSASSRAPSAGFHAAGQRPRPDSTCACRLQVPPAGVTPAGETYTYSPNDASVGDLDGDGEYEIVVKWDPSNAKDNSQTGYTGNVYLDAYKLDGTRLWRIDLGRNIRAGAHYTQFMVYDLDGDGKAEVACKTADGTVDGAGNVIGDPSADWRNTAGYILDGPEFLTVFDGQTGARAGDRSATSCRAARSATGATPTATAWIASSPASPISTAAAQPGYGARLLHARGARGVELARRHAHQRLDLRHRPHRHGESIRRLARPGQSQPQRRRRGRRRQRRDHVRRVRHRRRRHGAVLDGPGPRRRAAHVGHGSRPARAGSVPAARKPAPVRPERARVPRRAHRRR